MCESDEYAAYVTKAWPRARKQHTCCACHDVIEPGYLYHHTKVGMRGEPPEEYKHCARCYAICMALWKAGADAVDLTLDCGERWEDNFGALPDEVAQLAFMQPAEAQRLAEADRAATERSA